jgi:hypothetical protein
VDLQTIIPQFGDGVEVTAFAVQQDEDGTLQMQVRVNERALPAPPKPKELPAPKRKRASNADAMKEKTDRLYGGRMAAVIEAALTEDDQRFTTLTMKKHLGWSNDLARRTLEWARENGYVRRCGYRKDTGGRPNLLYTLDVKARMLADNNAKAA